MQGVANLCWYSRRTAFTTDRVIICCFIWSGTLVASLWSGGLVASDGVHWLHLIRCPAGLHLIKLFGEQLIFIRTMHHSDQWSMQVVLESWVRFPWKPRKPSLKKPQTTVLATERYFTLDVICLFDEFTGGSVRENKNKKSDSCRPVWLELHGSQGLSHNYDFLYKMN